MMGQVVEKVNIQAVLKGIGLKTVETVNPLALEKAIQTVKTVSAQDGVKAIIFQSPCAMLFKPEKPLQVCQEKCISCKKCINQLGCPAIVFKNNQIVIEDSLCNGCGLCSQVCPVHAIGGESLE